MDKYEIYIYNENVSFSNYNDEVYWDRESQYIIVKVLVHSKNWLFRKWNELFDIYDGYTYGVWFNDELICGGVFDPGDIDILKFNTK